MQQHTSAQTNTHVSHPHWHLTALSHGSGHALEATYAGQLDALREAQRLTLEALPVGGGLSTSRNPATGAMVNVVRTREGQTVAEIAVSALCREQHGQEVAHAS